MPLPFLRCMALVASVYHLPPRVLPSIAAVEGGAPHLAVADSNGTEDLGVMQVNSVWLGPLARYAHLDAADVRNRLQNQACFNIAAAGLILRVYLWEAHGDLMQAIGDYHSHTPILNAAYQLSVRNAAERLFVEGGAIRGRRP